MTLKVHGTPRTIEETFDDKDRTEIDRIISGLRQSYLERHTEALADYNKSQREVNRKLHEVIRIEKHLERIDAFCNKNNISTAIVLEGK